VVWLGVWLMAGPPGTAGVESSVPGVPPMNEQVFEHVPQ
jgi:hypothetical protein